MHIMKKLILSIILCLPGLLGMAAETFRNPVINADVPDISVCKVADTYYMISTTMHLMPGAPIMKSKDMVNWEVVSYVFDRIDDGDRYNLIDGKTVYGQGNGHQAYVITWVNSGSGSLPTVSRAKDSYSVPIRRRVHGSS